MKKENPLVSVIIVNWNGKQHIMECLDSVFRQSYRNFEVVLVDNDSTDGSQKIAKDKFHKIKLVQNDANVGFTKANNIGLRESSGEYVIFLNYDTAVEKDWMKELLSAIEKDSNIGACQSKVLIYGTDLINADGIDVNFLGVSWCADYRKKFVEEADDREIPCGTAASLMVRKDVLDMIGGFDDDYFMYHDDVDLSWRIRLAGYRIMLSRKSKVYHKYEFKRQTKSKFFNLERNRQTTLLKNYGLKSLILAFPAFVITELCIYAYSVLSGSFIDKLKSNLYILGNLGMILKKRSVIQKFRKISDREIIMSMKGGISFEEIDNPLLRYVLNPFLEIYFKIMKLFY
jgi:GT2 family glycosyltransferase